VVQPFPAPTFGHAAEAFVIAHAAPGAWSKGTAVKYRQTLSALDARLAESAPTAAADVAVLGTLAGACALEIAFTAAFGGLAPATRARHLAALRSALAHRRQPSIWPHSRKSSPRPWRWVCPRPALPGCNPADLARPLLPRSGGQGATAVNVCGAEATNR
jgi:hypothetical protein